MKVSRQEIQSYKMYGIPMEYIRELKFFTELSVLNHPNILKVSVMKIILFSYTTVLSKMTESTLLLSGVEEICWV